MREQLAHAQMQLTQQAQIMAENNRMMQQLLSHQFPAAAAASSSSPLLPQVPLFPQVFAVPAGASTPAASISASAEARELSERVEQVKVAVKLPKLERPSVGQPAVRCGDWIYQVRIIVQGMTETATTWWDHVEASAKETYDSWMSADAQEKYEITMAKPEEWPKYSMLSSKVSHLLLKAVSAEISRDAISERKTDPAEILFRILTLYQPGGLEERNTLLKLLREAKKGTTPATAVAAMKDWERIRKRAEEMKRMLPDPTEQWKCVLKMVETAVSANAELSFRFSMKRLELQIDQKTSATAVATMFRFLLAELTAKAT